MPKEFVAFTVVLCLVLIGCASQTTGPQNSAIPSSPTPQSTSLVEAAGGFARPEVGDTSSEVFEGTAGIVEKKRLKVHPVELTDVRSGRHETFDRVVLEFNGREVPGYHIEYVDRPVRQCGSGNVVPLAGDAWLSIQVSPANAHDENGRPTIVERERKLSLPVIKELKLICDFEAEVEWVLGVTKPNKYRVLELSNPSRLVVDIKH
jgi:hypothetical protein